MVTEVRTLSDGKPAEVRTVYVGLAQAYFVSPKGDAGIGRPGDFRLGVDRRAGDRAPDRAGRRGPPKQGETPVRVASGESAMRPADEPICDLSDSWRDPRRAGVGAIEIRRGARPSREHRRARPGQEPRTSLSQLRDTIKAEKLPDVRGSWRVPRAELAALKRELEDQTRSQDTKALELGNLQVAMKLRQDETTYVANLLDEFTNGFESSVHVSEFPKYKSAIETAKLARDDEDLSIVEKLSRRVGVLQVALDRLMDLVGGTRYDGQAVDAQGTVAKGEFAMVGPVVMFAAAGGLPAGSGDSAGGLRPRRGARDRQGARRRHRAGRRRRGTAPSRSTRRAAERSRT